MTVDSLIHLSINKPDTFIMKLNDKWVRAEWNRWLRFTTQTQTVGVSLAQTFCSVTSRLTSKTETGAEWTDATWFVTSEIFFFFTGVGKIICMRLSSWFSLSHTHTATNKQLVTHGKFSSRVVRTRCESAGSFFFFFGFYLSFSGQEASAFKSMFPRGEWNKTSWAHFENTCRTSHLMSDTTVERFHCSIWRMWFMFLYKLQVLLYSSLTDLVNYIIWSH